MKGGKERNLLSDGLTSRQGAERARKSKGGEEGQREGPGACQCPSCPEGRELDGLSAHSGDKYCLWVTGLMHLFPHPLNGDNNNNNIKPW